ncbi:c-type cytochrome [Rhodoferax ferrireducens]|uniref:c-type cytochrome n=1 Tax=Rhodoferax ferrireducens TaxID=192843 RepID=UPI000E0DC49B|nr:c-type cytochrome [Rhodoferax ferrireducens]
MTRTRFAAMAMFGLLPFFCHADALAVDAGQTLYQSVCRACHGPENVMVSAPKAGDTADWGQRLSRGSRGLETLADNAVNGFGAMPAKGGRSELSRDQILLAIKFMMQPRPSGDPSAPR